jgi:hypothetical protein
MAKKTKVQEIVEEQVQEVVAPTVNETPAPVLARANRVAVLPTENGFKASFFKTHKHVGDVYSDLTGWTANPDENKSAQRESFRQYVTRVSEVYGIKYDPEDRRSDENKVPAKYTSDELLSETAMKLVASDIDEWASKIPEITYHRVEAEYIHPITMTPAGKSVEAKYGNGNWAWAKVDIVVALTVGGQEIYATMQCDLVSGQLRKPRMIGDNAYTLTGFKTELGLNVKPTEESSAKAE